MTRIRIRGIYATALTAILDGLGTIVDPSPPIRARFEGDFPVRSPTVTVRDSADRLGVALSGEPDDVETVRDRLNSIGIDALSWPDPAPPGTVLDGTVKRTLGSGAIVSGGDVEGFLPFDSIDRRVSEGDEVTVQVHEAAAPWADRRPVVGGDRRADAGLIHLVRDGGAHRADVEDADRGTELIRLIEVLDATVPEGWAVRWQRGAVDATTEALDEALAIAVERAEELDTLAAGATPPRRTAWVRFGRESRRALDDRRDAVTPTVGGHHRLKLAGDEAGTAVDLVERLCGAAVDEVPFDAIAETIGPTTGASLRLAHGKPDGRCITLGTGTIVERNGETVTVERELASAGRYDGLGTDREPGDVARTELREGRWWYRTRYRGSEGRPKGTYVNVCTPIEVLPSAAHYVDLHVDVVRRPDGTVERLDDDELEAAVETGDVPEPLAERARRVATAIEDALA